MRSVLTAERRVLCGEEGLSSRRFDWSETQ